MTSTEARLLALFDMRVILASPNDPALCYLASERHARWSIPDGWKHHPKVLWRATRAGDALVRAMFAAAEARTVRRK